QDAWGHLVERWATFAPATAPVVCWREWLLPYAPWSLLALGGLSVARCRPWAKLLLAGLLLHLPFTVLLVGYIAAGEDGMYHLALAVPAVVVATQLLGPRAYALAAACGAALTLGFVAPHWPQPGTAAFGAGLQSLRQEGRFLLVATEAERDAARARVQ